MSARAAVVSSGAVSPLGVGAAAYRLGAVGEAATVAIRRDPALAALGFLRPMCARADAAWFDGAAREEDPAWVLLSSALDQAIASLPTAVRKGSDLRVGLALGTSAGGMRSAEQLFAARRSGESVAPALLRRATYFAPFERAKKRLDDAGLRVLESLQVVTACAASTIALGLAAEWLAAEEVDLVFAGGYDALGPFVAAGFESLRATTASAPAPFRLGRAGMSLGEGAGVVAMMRECDVTAAAFFVSGFGASADAVHVTAPDRTGAGLERAGRTALDRAGALVSDEMLVSAHATATPFNDAMESRAIRGMFGDADPVVHAMKAQIGHTLGAAGVLETLGIADALARGVAPATAGTGGLDPDAAVHLLDVAASTRATGALKLSAAFGGANAALVVESTRAASRVTRPEGRPAWLGATARTSEIDLELVATRSGVAADKIARFDVLSLMAATAVARLESLPPPGSVGVVVGHALATIDLNERFYSRVLEKGPASAEPRLFPPTSPNMVAGQLGILFGWTGPGIATASGPGGALDPLRVAKTLVECGLVDVVVALSVDLVGPCARAVRDGAFGADETIRDGAVVAVVTASPTGRVLVFDQDPAKILGFGHRALSAFLETFDR